MGSDCFGKTGIGNSKVGTVSLWAGVIYPMT